MQASQPAAKLNIHKSAEDTHTLLTFEGVIDEEFGGSEVAANLTCDVLILHLAQVKRITSFGIREWVSFIESVNTRCKRVFLVDCSPRFVIQLNMVVGFVGRSTVLSVLAPYICERCGHSSDRRMDLLGNEPEIRGFSPRPQACESCGNEAVFDDDPARFFSYISVQGRPDVQPETAAFLARYLDYQVGQGVAKVRVAKLVDGRNTVVRLLGELNDTLPVAEIQEGLEGEVAVDMIGVTRFTPSGLQHWKTLLRGVLHDVDRVRLFGLSPELIPSIREFLQGENLKLEVHSTKLPYRDQHSTTFSKEINLVEHQHVLRMATAPNLTGEGDEGTLVCIAEATTLIECSQIPVPAEAAEVTALVQRARQTLEMPDQVDQVGQRKRRWPFVVVASIGLGVVVAVGALLFTKREVPKIVAPATYQEASHLSPPGWKDKHIYIERGRITAISRSTLSPDKATAFSEASNAGLEELMYELLKAIPDKDWFSLVGAHVQRVRDAAYAGYETAEKSGDKQQIDQWQRRVRAGRERVSRSFGETSRELVPPSTDENYWESYRTSGEVLYKVWAQVSMSESNFKRLGEHYSKRYTAYGATVVSFFPLLTWAAPIDRGAIVVVVEPGTFLGDVGLRPGDILTKVNDLSVSDGLGFERQINHEYQGLRRTGGVLRIEVVDINGNRRMVSATIKQDLNAPVRGGDGEKQIPPANIWSEDPTL